MRKFIGAIVLFMAVSLSSCQQEATKTDVPQVKGTPPSIVIGGIKYVRTADGTYCPCTQGSTCWPDCLK